MKEENFTPKNILSNFLLRTPRGNECHCNSCEDAVLETRQVDSGYLELSPFQKLSLIFVTVTGEEICYNGEGSEKGVADCTGCGSKNERKRRRARQTERKVSENRSQ